MTLGSCLAGYSGGMSAGLPTVGIFVAVGIIIGAVVSYAVRVSLIRSPVIKLDGWLYTCCVLSAFAFGNRLQGLMPEGGFPIDVAAAGWLSWMLILGSFFTWQDTTLLFQAIPSIAMFGLAGVYDTFRGVTFAFFGFLLCLATLFARAHRRSMLRQAADSGYFTRGLAPGTPTPSVETTPGLALKMEQGPWRWIAGPGWALASAFAVVLISLLGAPVIKESMKASGLSGFVKVQVPRSLQQKAIPPAAASAMTENPGGSVSIAQGQNNLTSDPIFEAKMDTNRYLRMATYDLYLLHRWDNNFHATQFEKTDDVNAESLGQMRVNVKPIDFEIRLRRPVLKSVPVPGFVMGWKGAPPVMDGPDGRSVITGMPENQTFKGRSQVIDDSARPPTEAVHDLPHVFQQTIAGSEGLSERTKELVRQVTAGAKNDYERAEAIRRAVADRIVYNIDADAVPSDKDPVDYVLFEKNEGYCDVYATCMTMLARAAGIPARYVIGYLPEAANVDAAGNYVVLDSDLHAWSELFFKDYGWVIFDATDGARAVPGHERGKANKAPPLLERAWVRAALDITMAVLALGGLALILRSMGMRQRSRTPRKDLEREYVHFTRLLERTGRTRREMSRTPDEFLALVRPRLGTAADAAAEINRRFVRLMFSPVGATEEDVVRMRADLRNLGQMLRNVPPPPKERTRRP
ncbi:DUF4129 domain-containing transglutaminase family protein [Fimbriimonas ginsengisoli]|nr:transglutaminase domain-containing protein [Fimbriimonas ginsengisoli]